MFPVLNDLLWFSLIGVVGYRMTPRLWRRTRQHVRTWWRYRKFDIPEAKRWAMERDQRLEQFPTWPDPPLKRFVSINEVPRIAFDYEAQASVLSPVERRIFEATVKKSGPVLIDAPPKRPTMFFTPSEIRVIQEFFPGFDVRPGKWLWIEDWPEGWDDEEENFA